MVYERRQTYETRSIHGMTNTLCAAKNCVHNGEDSDCPGADGGSQKERSFLICFLVGFIVLDRCGPGCSQDELKGARLVSREENSY